MKIEAGKRYMRRDGVITGPLMHADDEVYGLEDPETAATYTAGGQEFEGDDSGTDLVQEYVELPAHTIGYLREQRRYELTKTLIGALAPSLTNSDCTMEEYAQDAVMFADIVLAELEK